MGKGTEKKIKVKRKVLKNMAETEDNLKSGSVIMYSSSNRIRKASDSDQMMHTNGRFSTAL
jgi:hypothetical protein